MAHAGAAGLLPGREFRLQLIGPVLNENGRLGQRRARVHANLWVSDFTPVHTTDGFVYTAFFVDVPCATERRLASFAGPANRPPGGLTSPLANGATPASDLGTFRGLTQFSERTDATCPSTRCREKSSAEAMGARAACVIITP